VATVLTKLSKICKYQ